MGVLKKNSYYILCVVILLWLLLIFVLSAQSATQSNGFSELIVETIIGTIVSIVPVDIDATIINGLVAQSYYLARKFVHGWIYLVLGVFLIITISKTRLMGFRAYALAMIGCISYAVIDEIHQMFVPGRSGQISDVLIDTAGAALGIGSYWVYHYFNYLHKK